jgi:hypothetical protein
MEHPSSLAGYRGSGVTRRLPAYLAPASASRNDSLSFGNPSRALSIGIRRPVGSGRWSVSGRVTHPRTISSADDSRRMDRRSPLSQTPGTFPQRVLRYDSLGVSTYPCLLSPNGWRVSSFPEPRTRESIENCFVRLVPLLIRRVIESG